MIVEGAFLKLLWSLINDPFPDDVVEDTLRGNLIWGLHQEVTALNVGMPLLSGGIKAQYKYSGLSKKQPAWRADIYAKYQLGDNRYERYGFKPENWIEIKFFFGISRGRYKQDTTGNAAEIARDLVRLCLLVEELPGKIGDKARYLLVVFNEEPRRYVAFARRNGGENDRSRRERKWLCGILQPGYWRGRFDLKDEPMSFRTHLGDGFKEDDHSLALDLDITVHSWEPCAPSTYDMHPLFWGYLVRINNFTVWLDDFGLKYFDKSRDAPDRWTEKEISAHQSLIAQFSKYGVRRTVQDVD